MEVILQLHRRRLAETGRGAPGQGLAPHWDGECFRFMLVMRTNPEPVDWRLQIEMTLQDYQKVSAEERKLGRFPPKVMSYGDEADVRYAALWVRYRVQE